MRQRLAVLLWICLCIAVVVPLAIAGNPHGP
jgi:hypothetical protein